MRMGHLRPPRQLAPADLKGAALDYLDRFAAPRARLRQVMLRKIRNSVRPMATIRAADRRARRDHPVAGDERLPERPRLCRGAARSLSARGTSRAHIIAKLSAKGVESETARAAVDRLSMEYEEPELEAARRYARRRRLGPYRGADDARAECRDKDLAAMARAGFAGRVARQIIDAEREA